MVRTWGANMNWRRFLLTACLLVAACGSDAEHAKRTVADSLRDPSSAQFREVRKVRLHFAGNRVTLICGEVNAKNGFGGYVGFRPFYYVADAKVDPQFYTMAPAIVHSARFDQEVESCTTAEIVRFCEADGAEISLTPILQPGCR
jgi:hypothetical protein